MATAKMSKLKIVGCKSDQKAILELLTRSGSFEVSKATKAVDDIFENTVEIDVLKSNQAKVGIAIEYLNKLSVEAVEVNKSIKKGDIEEEEFKFEKTKKSFARIELTYDDISKIRKEKVQLLDICDKLQCISLERLELNAKKTELSDLIIELQPFCSVTLPLSHFNDTNSASALLASSPNPAEKEAIIRLGCFVEEYPTNEGALWGILCKKEDRTAVVRKLTAIGFELCTIKYDKPAQQIIDESNALIEKLDKQFYFKLREGLAYLEHLTCLKALYDIIDLDLEHLANEPNFYTADNTVTIEGWAPTKAASAIQSKLTKEIKNINIAISGVEAGDEPPSLMVNPKLIKPFESVPKGYAAPTYGELDPTAVMSIFFFIFFGIMLADAGYGLIMAVVGLLVGMFIKFEKPMKRMILMFAICGISGIIFGLVFGGVFAIPAISTFITEDSAIFFNPLDDPIRMLIMSIGLGVVHLLVGYTLKSIGTWREGFRENKKAKIRVFFDGLFDSLFMYTLFGGVAAFALPMVLGDVNFPFSTVALILFVVTLVGIVLTGGRRAPKLGGKIAGGFGGIYKLINVFSDVLSYARLFGLAIASGAIAMAFNQIGSLLFDFPIVGYALGGIALVLLHTFNFLLSALAAYVHNIRLQYVEFFGKFYNGNGRFFMPLGENTKFVRFVEK